MGKKRKKNYLDFIPVHHDGLRWEEEEGNITVFVEHKGFFPWIAQKFFRRPRVSRVRLDETGSFIWKQIDGMKTVYEIAGLVKEEYGEQAEPLYDRLVAHMRNLEQYQFITMKD